MKKLNNGVKSNAPKTERDTKCINLFGYKFKEGINPFDDAIYTVFLPNSEEVYKLYDEIREIAYHTNFSGNPRERNAFMYFHYKGVHYYIGPPMHGDNGDSNWHKYSDDSLKAVEITDMDESCYNVKKFKLRCETFSDWWDFFLDNGHQIEDWSKLEEERGEVVIEFETELRKREIIDLMMNQDENDNGCGGTNHYHVMWQTLELSRFFTGERNYELIKDND